MALNGITSSQGGSNLQLSARPKSGRVAMSVGDDGFLRVRLTSPPEDGKANKQLLKVLAECLGTAPSRLSLVAGEHSRTKVVFVPGLSREELTLLLERRVNE